MRIERLQVGYPGEPALVRDWTATLAPGVTLLHGDTGSGKTTLLRVLAGERSATSGRLALAPRGSAGIDAVADPAAYRAQVCWLDPTSPDHEQTAASALPEALGVDADRWRAHALAFGLEPHLDKPMYMLSTGSRRKAWLAAALASPRPLLLLDEPTGALDRPSIAHLTQALASLARERARIVVVASGQALPPEIDVAATIALPIDADADDDAAAGRLRAGG